MYKNIVFPVDLSDNENAWRKALDLTLEYCDKFGSTLHVVNVVSDYGMNIVEQYFPKAAGEKIVEQANQLLHQFVENHIPSSVKVQHIVAKGPVYQCIIQSADEIHADLIVMTAHRPELKDYLLGPNAAKVVRHSKCSVLVVRDEHAI